MEGGPAPEKRFTMSDFQFIKVLGRGSFGKVVLCREKASQVGYKRNRKKGGNFNKKPRFFKTVTFSQKVSQNLNFRKKFRSFS
jgi:hypothetical protein